MVIIRDCYEKGVLIELKIHEERCRVWKQCLEKSRQWDKRFDIKLLELGIFWSYDITFSSIDSNEGSGNDLVLSSFNLEI